MNQPESIKVECGHSDLGLLSRALREYIQIHRVPGDELNNLARCAAQAMLKRVIKKMLESKVNSLKLNPTEYWLILAMNREIMSAAAQYGLEPFVRQIHPKIC